MAIFCTYFDRKYLLKGLALIESLQKHALGFTLYVVCLDEETRLILSLLDIPGVNPIPLHEIEYGDQPLLRARDDRSLIEYYRTLTPSIILRVMDRLKENETLVYVDADLYFYSSPAVVCRELGDNDVLLHKHNFSHDLGQLTYHGIYNVGLMCFKNTNEGRKIAFWWRNKCIEWCKDELLEDSDGYIRYGDQKYLEHFFEISNSVVVTKHMGIGVAPWNHTACPVAEREDGTPLFGGIEVVCYHYHAFFMHKLGIAFPFAHAHYKCTLDSLRIFGTTYMAALSRARENVLKVFSAWSDSFSPEVGGAVCLKLEGETKNFAPFRYKLTAQYTCTLTRQLMEYKSLVSQEEYMASRPHNAPENLSEAKTIYPELEKALQRYARWPQKLRLLHLGCRQYPHGIWLNLGFTHTHPQQLGCDLFSSWPLPDNFFDAVYSPLWVVFERVGKIGFFVRELTRILKPKGVLHLIFPQQEEQNLYKEAVTLLQCKHFVLTANADATHSAVEGFAQFFANNAAKDFSFGSNLHLEAALSSKIGADAKGL